WPEIHGNSEIGKWDSLQDRCRVRARGSDLPRNCRSSRYGRTPRINAPSRIPGSTRLVQAMAGYFGTVSLFIWCCLSLSRYVGLREKHRLWLEIFLVACAAVNLMFAVILLHQILA